MPNDAKLGLVVGVGLVVAFAVVFFHKDAGANVRPDGATTAVTTEPPPRPPNPARSAGNAEARLQHTVKEGETLFSLARQYYGDAERSLDIYRVNRNVLKAPDQLAPGMVLTLPDVPRPTDDE